MEKFLIIIKPGFTKHKKSIASALTNIGVKINGTKQGTLSKKLAEEHYAEHKGKPFYNELVNYMSSGNSIVMWCEGGTGIISLTRDLVGSTKNPDEGTIRRIFGIGDVTKNVIHCSDSKTSGQREYNLFFNNINQILPSNHNKSATL